MRPCLLHDTANPGPNFFLFRMPWNVVPLSTWRLCFVFFFFCRMFSATLFFFRLLRNETEFRNLIPQSAYRRRLFLCGSAHLRALLHPGYPFRRMRVELVHRGRTTGLRSEGKCITNILRLRSARTARCLGRHRSRFSGLFMPTASFYFHCHVRLIQKKAIPLH